MNEHTIATIALSNRDYASFEDKLLEAAHWVEHAARNGAELAVLPEALDIYRGDGDGNPNALDLRETAVSDWETAVASLLDAARRAGIAVTIPLFIRDDDGLRNAFFLVSNEGELLGRYDEQNPTLGELEAGVRPGQPQPLMQWEGLRIGGAICFDTLWPDVFTAQAERGADLFLVPSMWPGGDYLNYHALVLGTPIAVAYPAWSRIIDITGKDVAGGGHRNETLRFGFGSPVVVATLNFDRVALYGNENQEKMVAVESKYGARIRVRFDQPNCLFFLESRAPDLTVAEVIAEFELERTHDYLARCARGIAQQHNQVLAE